MLSGEGWNVSSAFFDNFSIMWDLSVETAWSRCGRHGLVSYTPETLRLRWKRNLSPCVLAGISVPIQLSAQEQVFSLEPQCAFPLCIGPDPGSKSKIWRGTPIPGKGPPPALPQETKIYHRQVQTLKLMCVLINESTAQSEKLSRSPCKAGVWIKVAEEQEAVWDHLSGSRLPTTLDQPQQDGLQSQGTASWN